MPIKEKKSFAAFHALFVSDYTKNQITYRTTWQRRIWLILRRTEQNLQWKCEHNKQLFREVEHNVENDRISILKLCEFGTEQSNRIVFDSIFNRKVAETFLCNSILILYWFVFFFYRLDSIQDCINSSHKRKSAIRNMTSFQKNCPLWRHIYLTMPFIRFSSVLFLLFCRISMFSCSGFCRNRIESYWKRKHSLYSHLDTIWFNLNKNIWRNSKIRFDFDSFWQPWQFIHRSTGARLV